METPTCPPEENILRAVATPHWDRTKGRLQQSYFEYRPREPKDGISVARLAVSDQEALRDVFMEQVDNPPNYAVLGQVEINIGVLQEIGINYREQPSNKPRPVVLTVVPDPLENFEAHALIPHRITRGLSRVICEYLEENELITMWGG